MAVKCPKGHWYEPDASGGRCPQCATQTQSETSISDDDVLAIINLPIEGSPHRASPGATRPPQERFRLGDSSP